MTSATSSTTGGISRQGRRPLHERGAFHALAPTLRQFAWPDRFKPGPIDKYDGSRNLEEFIQVYHTVIEATGGDGRVKAKYLPAALSNAARS
jgi:hypothetical protein